jgi:hypothetical protein
MRKPIVLLSLFVGVGSVRIVQGRCIVLALILGVIFFSLIMSCASEYYILDKVPFFFAKKELGFCLSLFRSLLLADLSTNMYNVLILKLKPHNKTS